MKSLMQDEILQLLEGHEDILTPLAEQRADFISRISCPICGGKCSTTPHPTKPFVDGELLPNIVGKCLICDALFDPTTKVILHSGSATMIEPVTIGPNLSFRR